MHALPHHLQSKTLFVQNRYAGLEKRRGSQKMNCRSHICPAYADWVTFPNLSLLGAGPVAWFGLEFGNQGFVKVLFLRLIDESDLAFLPVLVFHSTRKQFHIEFCGA